MNSGLFSVYDSKADFFHPPFVASRAAAAERMFRQAATEKGSQFWQFPGDFDLFLIGSFDASSGLVKAVVPAQLIVKGSSLIKADEQKELGL